MIGQSLAIIAVILVMVFMFLRTGRRVAAIFVLPLTSVSVFHLIGAAVYRLLVASEYPTMTLYCGIDLAGLLVGAILCIIFSRLIAVKRLRAVYLIFSLVFLTALCIAYILYLT